MWARFFLVQYSTMNLNSKNSKLDPKYSSFFKSSFLASNTSRVESSRVESSRVESSRVESSRVERRGPAGAPRQQSNQNRISH